MSENGELMTLEAWAGAQNLALTLVFTDIVESTRIGIKQQTLATEWPNVYSSDGKK